MTSMPGVFAGGDCGNDKISTAVEAIADAKKASAVIDAYLNGESVKYEKPYVVTRDDITEKTFEDRERQCRPKCQCLACGRKTTSQKSFPSVLRKNRRKKKHTDVAGAAATIILNVS